MTSTAGSSIRRRRMTGRIADAELRASGLPGSQLESLGSLDGWEFAGIRSMAELKKVQPKSRAAWREWLEKHHATSPGIWLVFAKKHTGLPTLSYEDAVQEALCFGWIDSLMKSIDDRFHMQMFTPRKPKSAWSATNKARLAKLMKAGVMAPAGLAAVAAAKKSGSWKTYADVDKMTIPPELQRAFDANPDAKKNWPTYTPSCAAIVPPHGEQREAA